MVVMHMSQQEATSGCGIGLASQSSTRSLLKLITEKKASRQLDYIYKQVPSFPCIKCGLCCFNCCETHYLEYLNILNYVKKLPAERRARLVHKVVGYEFLNLLKIDLECPFLDDNECVIYQKRPLACRFFGLYPEKEYGNRRDDSQSANRNLAEYYRENFGLKIPDLVVSHDVDQCEHNRNEEGKVLALSFYERERLQEMYLSVEDRVFPEEMARPRGEVERFSYFFIKNFLGEGELFEIRLALMRDYLENGRTAGIDEIIRQYKVKF